MRRRRIVWTVVALVMLLVTGGVSGLSARMSLTAASSRIEIPALPRGTPPPAVARLPLLPHFPNVCYDVSIGRKGASTSLGLSMGGRWY